MFKKMYKFKEYLLLMIFAQSILSIGVFAQTERLPDFRTVKTEKGMMVLNYNEPQPFAFLVAGQDIAGKQLEDGSLILGNDEKVLYVTFVKTSSFLDVQKTYNDAEILFAYRDWDLANQEKGWKSPINVDDKGFYFMNLANNQKVSSVFWTYRRPNRETPLRDLYQSVLIGNMILMIGTSIESDDKTAAARQFFKETIESLILLPSQVKATSKDTNKPKAASKPKKTKGKIKNN